MKLLILSVVVFLSHSVVAGDFPTGTFKCSGSKLGDNFVETVRIESFSINGIEVPVVDVKSEYTGDARGIGTYFSDRIMLGNHLYLIKEKTYKIHGQNESCTRQ